MTAPEGYEQEIVSSGGRADLFDYLVDDIVGTSKSEERLMRHAVYSQVSAVFAKLLPGSQTAESLHTLPMEFVQDLGQRTVFLCRDRVPAHGGLVRAIINDEVHEAVTGDRRLHIRDFVISTVQKTLTFQQSTLVRAHTEHLWRTADETGPRLCRRDGRLDVVSGANYNVHIPKTAGFPHRPAALMEQRLLLENLVEDLSVLGEVTHEPGHPSKSGIMS
ncbi:hypothetical protein BH09PAT4_BH09PAT4_01890 [soil metagenome]